MSRSGDAACTNTKHLALVLLTEEEKIHNLHFSRATRPNDSWEVVPLELHPASILKASTI